MGPTMNLISGTHNYVRGGSMHLGTPRIFFNGFGLPPVFFKNESPLILVRDCHITY